MWGRERFLKKKGIQSKNHRRNSLGSVVTFKFYTLDTDGSINRMEIQDTEKVFAMHVINVSEKQRSTNQFFKRQNLKDRQITYR